MELITHEVGRHTDGTRIVRNYFLYDKPIDWFKITHSYFTKDQRKQAKLQHKSSLQN